MLDHCRSELEAFSLLAVADVATRLGSSIDPSNVSSSYGKALPCDVPDNSSAEHEQRASSRHLLASEEATIRSRLLEAASATSHHLSNSTVTDDEAATLRSLPRGTLEILLLATSSTYRSYRHLFESQGIPHPFGAIMGPEFEALVESGRAKRAAEPVPSLLAPYQVVRRSGTEATIPTQALEAGDVMILKVGEVAPCDALFLGATPSSADVFVSAQRLNGSSMRVRRRFGPYRSCTDFGAESILPQQSIVTSQDLSAVVVAIALKSPQESSWMVRQKMAMATESRAEPERIRQVELLPFFAAPQPSVHQLHRHALLKLSQCPLILIECEEVLLDEHEYEVTDALWGSNRYPASMVSQLWNVSDVLSAQRNQVNALLDISAISEKSALAESSQALANSSILKEGSYRIQSFISESERPSRLPLVASTSGLRPLLIAAMLATCYPPQARTERSAEHLANKAVRHFISHDPYLRDQCMPNYQPICDPALITVKGKQFYARLFEYKIANAAREDVKNHAVLVAYGAADVIVSLTSFVSTSRGQQRVDTDTVKAVDKIKKQVVCSPDFLIGFATADILWSYVGTKNTPTPTDLASLLAQTTSLCYQGALICQVGLKKVAIDGIDALASQGKRVCVTSFARGQSHLETILGRCTFKALQCKSPRVTVPDVLNRWLVEHPPQAGEVVGLSAAGWDPSALLPRYFHWANGGEGVAYCGATCSSLVGLKLADVPVQMTGGGDAVATAVLRSVAVLQVSQYAIDDLAAACDLATAHIKACSTSQ